MTIQSTLYKIEKKYIYIYIYIIIIMIIIIIIIWGVSNQTSERKGRVREKCICLFSNFLLHFCMRVMICTGSGFGGGHSKISIIRVL